MTDTTVTHLRPVPDEPDDELPLIFQTVTFEGEAADEYRRCYRRHAKEGRMRPELMAMVEVQSLLLLEGNLHAELDMEEVGEVTVTLMEPYHPFPA